MAHTYVFALALLLPACGDTPVDTGDVGTETAAPRLVPPTLAVDSPARGAFFADTVVFSGQALAGDGALDALTLNNDAIALDTDGRFSVALTPPPGLLVLGSRLTAADGGRAVDGRAVQVGPVRPPGDRVPRAVRVELGRAFLDNDTPANDDLASVIQVMLRDPSFGAQLAAAPMTASGVTVQLRNVQIGDAAVDISPATGVMHLDLTLSNVNAGYDATSPVLDTPGTLHMDVMQLQLDVEVHPLAIGVEVTVPYAQASIQGFSWTADSLPSFLTSLLEGVVQGVVEDKMTEQGRTLVQAMVADTLNAFTQEIVYGDNGEVVVAVAVADAEAHPGGLVLWLDGLVRASSAGVHLPPGGGSLRTDAPLPAWPVVTTHSMTVVVDDDLVNQALFAAWHAGMLTDLRYTGAELRDLTGADLPEPLGPAASAVLGLQLPPVITPPTGDGGVDIGLGELWLQVERQDGQHVDASLNLRLEAELVVTDTSLRLAIDNRPSHVGVDVGMMAWPEALDPGDLAGLFRLSAPALVRESSAIAPPFELPGIPLSDLVSAPSLAGETWRLTNVDHHLDAGGALVLSGDITL